MDVFIYFYEAQEIHKNPLICMDEKPIQLLDHARPPCGIEPGKVSRIDYEYKRKGTCNVFCAVEPFTGRYFAKVTQKRTANDFAQFIKDLSEQYPDSDRITLVMDNLNTHSIKSLIKEFGEDQAKRIWQRFDVHYTPKHASWLNQAEIAINIYARQCLGKSRIPSIDVLEKKTKAWLRYINEKNVIIKWKFKKSDARKKFKYL